MKERNLPNLNRRQKTRKLKKKKTEQQEHFQNCKKRRNPELIMFFVFA